MPLMWCYSAFFKLYSNLERGVMTPWRENWWLEQKSHMSIWMESEVLDVWLKKWDSRNHGVDRWGVGGDLADKRMADTTCECTECLWTVQLKWLKC